MYRNFKNIDKVVFGKGSFGELDPILGPVRKLNDGFIVFVVDNYFKGRDLEGRIPVHSKDLVFFEDIDGHEPTTEQVDKIRDEVLNKKGLPSGVVGIGGGSILDIAKALSLMLTNEGSSSLYQGLNLIKKPGVYHLGVPTIAGTGAECSMTAVLTGPEKKLGLKCDWTVFNQVILDPDLTVTVPRNQWFYTGMDCFIHCIESESGIFYNEFSRAYGDQAIKLCREVFLGSSSGQDPLNNEKLMVASLFGGLSLSYSEVGVCHALSYGLSFVFGTRHGLANCIAFNQLHEYYGKAVGEFREMIRRHGIELPQNLASKWSSSELEKMADVAYRLPHMWTHALGYDWEKKITRNDIVELYRRM
ncbi:MAG TPA: iron-containing alcohol dehydrogenase family protein [Cyclobacteriaceae bacterium]|nr:iron-containing alcohol dehydrogenase family protein [Cyclobacteriaceae bacterium]